MDPVANMPSWFSGRPPSAGILPIWVGVYEANAIALEIEKVQTPRPMTHDLLKNVLTGLNVPCTKSASSPICGTTLSTPSSGWSATARPCQMDSRPVTPWRSRCGSIAPFSSKMKFSKIPNQQRGV